MLKISKFYCFTEVTVLLFENILNKYLEPVPSDELRFSSQDTAKVKDNVIFNDLMKLYGKDNDAALLSKKIRILCWVLTQKATLQTKAKAVKETWGRHCNVMIFVSSEFDEQFPAISLNVKEGKDFIMSLDFYVFEGEREGTR